MKAQAGYQMARAFCNLGNGGLRMKKKRRFRKYHLSAWILVSLLASLFIAVFLYDFSQRVDYQIHQIILDHLSDIAKQSVEEMEREIQGLENEVTFTADYLGKMGDASDEQVDLLLDHMKVKCKFTEVRMVDAYGRLYTMDRELIPRSAGDYIEKIMAGKSGITNVFRSSVSGDEVFVIFAPVIRDGKVIGGITGTTDVGQLVDFIDSTGFDSHCYSYIIKSDGNLMMQTSHPESLYDGRAYYYFLDKLTDKCSIRSDELRGRLEKKESGTFTYSVGDQSRLVCYMPTSVNNWYVVTTVSTRVAEAYIGKINITAYHLTAKVTVIFILLTIAILIWSGKTTRLILKSREELELGNQRLELAMAHSANTIFEYRVKEDQIVFLSSARRREKDMPEVIDYVLGDEGRQILVDPDYSAIFAEALKKASAGNEIETSEILGGSAFEEDSWYKMSLSPVHNAGGETVEVIGTVEDITEEKRIRRRYAQEEKYRTAILSESVALWSVDLTREAMLTCFAFGRDQMGGHSFIPYDEKLLDQFCVSVHPEDQEKLRMFLQLNHMLAAYYIGQGEIKELIRMRLTDRDKYRWVSVSISLLSEPSTGNPNAFAYMKDVDQETRLAHSFERDPLTGLYNRRNIDKKIGEALIENTGLACMMMLDLDGFKEVNDRFGHQEGDHVLKQIGQILTDAFRADDLVVRLGGDEFLVFLNSLPDEKAAGQRAEDVLQKVYDMRVMDESHDVSVSIGIAFAPKDGEDFETLYKKADEALYAAKRGGKNRIELYAG